MIEVVRDDLEAIEAEALVRPVRSDGEAFTPAGRRLEVGAGEAVLERLRGIGEMPLGGAMITPAGDLAADFVIHVAVSSPEEGVSPSVVRRALLNALRRAGEWELSSLALPLIGAGAGQLGTEEAARLLVEVLSEHARGGQHPTRVTVAAGDEYQEGILRRLIRALDGEEGAE